MDSESRPNFKKKKKKFTGIKNQMKNMSKEAVRAALLKKKQCNDRAIQIVNLLIEPGVSEELLLSCLYEINQNHFDDIIEERAISKICGYPLCSSTLKDVPHKQFQISTKTNKVYDITERKNFCSNLCYKAGKFLKDQMYTSPLWLREHEDPVTFRLLSFNVNRGSSGEEVDFGNSRITLEDEKDTGDNADALAERNECQTSMSDRNDEVVADIVMEEDTVCEDTVFSVSGDSATESSVDITSRLSVMDLSEEITSNSPSDFKIIRESISPEPCSVQINSTSSKPSPSRPVKKKPLSPKEIIMKIENVMRSWFTFETFCFLLGEEKIRNQLDKYGMKLQHQDKDPFLYDRYADLCKRLNLLELEETYGAKEIESPKRPLPDFSKLKEESKQLEIKVNSFFKGSMEFEIEEAQEISEEQLPILPPLDHYATKSARRRIFMQKLCHFVPDIQVALGLVVPDISHLIKEFVVSLNLTAQNISLKPSEWNIVAIVLIKLLSLRDNRLKEGLNTKKASNYLELILMSYTLDSGYLDRLVGWLLDIEYLVNSDQS